MTLEERWREIEEAIKADLAEAEIENGHEEVFGGSETPPPEGTDELTPPEVGEADETDEDQVYIELPPDAAAPPQEVEGFDEEITQLSKTGQ